MKSLSHSIIGNRCQSITLINPAAYWLELLGLGQFSTPCESYFDPLFLLVTVQLIPVTIFSHLVSHLETALFFSLWIPVYSSLRNLYHFHSCMNDWRLHFLLFRPPVHPYWIPRCNQPLKVEASENLTSVCDDVRKAVQYYLLNFDRRALE